MSDTSIEKIVALFPIQTVKPIIGEPTFESLNELTSDIKANASSIPTTRGGGDLGHLILTVSPAIYLTLSNNDVFNVPPNPGTLFVVPGGNPTGAQIAEAVRAHTEGLREYNLYRNTDRAIKQQVIGAVDNTYIRALKHRQTGFANVTTLQLLTHLLTTYGRITPYQLEENDKRFKKPFDPNQPFETLVEQIDDATDYAIAGGSPYTVSQIVSNAYNLVFNTGMFPEACREWRLKPEADKTWETFKTDFAVAHIDLRNLRHTSQTGGYQQANQLMEVFATETADAFLNLATATAADRDSIRTLTTAIEALTKQVALQGEENRTLRAHLGNKTTTSQKDPEKKRNKNNNYCWTHGHDCHDTHTSATCKTPGKDTS